MSGPEYTSLHVSWPTGRLLTMLLMKACGGQILYHLHLMILWRHALIALCGGNAFFRVGIALAYALDGVLGLGGQTA